MAIKSSVMSAPTTVMAHGHPYATTAGNNVGGIPIFINVESKSPEPLDLWKLKDEGVIRTAFGTAIGDVGHGKSTCMKLIGSRSAMMSAGFDTMRVAINDYKPEGKESEYSALSAVTRSAVFNMGEMSVNPFDRRLFEVQGGTVYELGLLDMAQVISEFSKKESLDGSEDTALRVGVGSLLTLDELFRDPAALQKILRSIGDDEIKAYFQNLDGTLRTQMTARLETVTSDVTRERLAGQIKTIVERPDTYDIAEIARAGHRVANYLGRVVHGSYSHMFGNTHSLYDMYTQRVITKDWRKMRPDAERLMRLIDTTIKISAIENNRIDLLPHLELDDEKHKSMDDLVYARTNAFHSEIARSTHTANISSTHRLDSIRKGGVGSEQYRLGATIINNQGFVILGKQKNDPVALKELQERYRLTNAYRNLLPELPPYTFILVLGDTEAPKLVRTFVTPSELKMIGTNSATDRMVNRPDVRSDADNRRFAEMNGYTYTTPETESD